MLEKPDKLRGSDLRWTSIPSRVGGNTSRYFMLQKPGVSCGSYGPVFALRLHTACDKLTSLDTVRASKPEIPDPNNCKLPKEL